MSTATQRAHIILANKTYPLAHFTGTEDLSAAYVYEASWFASSTLNIALMQAAEIIISLAGETRRIKAVITNLKQSHHAHGQWIQARLEPKLALLALQNTSKLFQHKPLSMIIHHYLKGVAYKEEDIHCNHRCSQQMITQWLQLPEETDAKAWQRLLHHYQLYYRIDVLGRIIILNNYEPRPFHSIATLNSILETSMLVDKAIHYSFIQLHQVRLPTADNNFETLAYDQSDSLNIKTHFPSLMPGLQIEIKTSEPHIDSNQCYTVISVKHVSQQALSKDKSLQYYNEVTLIPSSVPIQSPKPKPQQYGLIIANTVSDDAYPHLSSVGDYSVQLPYFETKQRVAMGRMSCNMGAQQGMHTPYPHNASVILGFVYSKASMPIMLGAIANDHYLSPVTKANASQAIIKTQGQQLLSFDKNAQQIMLSNTHSHHIVLGKLAHKTMISCETSGNLFMRSQEMHYNIQGQWHQRSGLDYEIQVVTDYQQQIAGTYQQLSKNRVDLLARRDVILTCHQALQINAEKNIELIASKDQGIIVKTGNAICDLQQALQVLAEEEIFIESDTDIILKAGNSHIVLSKEGSVELMADHVMINAKQQATLFHQIDHSLSQ